MSLSDAAMARLLDTLERPDAGERYVIGALLGRGGMAAVYQAHDRVLAREVALKVLAVDADAPTVVASLAREARVLARLEHPGIVAVHDSGVLVDGRPFYVMRLVRGERLDSAARTASVGGVLRLFLQVCSAVAYAHAHGVVHRDLKPSNVMVGPFGEVLVLDWGVAQVAADADAPAVVVGTPGFMAPEQADRTGQPVDARADIFSLGAVLRELLALRNERVPAPLASVVACATAADPAARYADVNALADDVRHWLDGERVAAHTEGFVERAARLYRRNRALILLLVAYAVVRVAIFLFHRV